MALIKQTGIVGNHPVLVATTAASGGVLLGAYVAMQIFAAPIPNDAKIPAAAPVAESKPPVRAIETTASAPAKEETAGDRCDSQTWPHLSRECIERMQKNRPARVVTTDRVETPAPEPQAQPRSESVASLPAPVAPAPVAPANTAAPPAAISPAPAPAATNTFAPNTDAPPQPAVKVAPASSKPAVAAAPPAPLAEPAPKPTVAVAAPGNPQDASTANESAAASKAAEKRKAKEARKEAKRKKERENVVRENLDRENLDADGLALASVERDREGRSRDDEERADRGDRAERRSLRAESRSDRSRRERFASRGEDEEGDAVPDRRGGRRVVVIERDSFEGEGRRGLFGRGGLFGGLFGD